MEGGGATQPESELAGTPASYSAVRWASSFIHIHGFGCGKPLTELSRPCPWVSQSVSGGSASHWASAPGGLAALLGGRGAGCLTPGLAQVGPSAVLCQGGQRRRDSAAG